MSTQTQSTVGDALEALHFELQPASTTGGPQEFKPTDRTVEFVNSLLNDEKSLSVDSRGSVTIIDSSDAGESRRSAK
jgi:hypothetical protein